VCVGTTEPGGRYDDNLALCVRSLHRRRVRIIFVNVNKIQVVNDSLNCKTLLLWNLIKSSVKPKCETCLGNIIETFSNFINNFQEEQKSKHVEW